MRADPGRQVLTAGGLGIDQSTGAQHADEQLDGDLFARRRIDQVRPLPREIDKQLLARAMHLSHRRLQPAGPLRDTARRIGCRRSRSDGRAILLPQEHERDAGFFQLEVELTPIGKRPNRPPRATRAGQTGALPGPRHPGPPPAATSARPPRPAGDRRDTVPKPIRHASAIARAVRPAS